MTLTALAACNSNGTHRDAAHRDGSDKARRPNIVVILTDTVRADRMGAHGYWRPTSPFFDRFARDNFLFLNAFSPCSWTRPAVASLFTGMYPQRHGVQMRQDALSPALPTLAETLLEGGFETAMVNTNPHVTDAWGMTRGFAHTVPLMPHPDQLKAGNGADVVLRHVRKLLPTLREPFFLYVHMIDPHYPFEPPRKDLDAIGIKAEAPMSSARYDGELHFVDRHIEGMIEALDRTATLDNTIVVLTSDHGEEFLDHGSTGHGKTLYQEVVHVPLAIGVPPGLRQRLQGSGESFTTCPQIRDNVSLVDLMPTLLGATGLRTPVGIDGENLIPLMTCSERPTRPLFFSVEKERSSLAAALMGETKLIVDRISGRRRLYLLDENPREQPDNLGAREGMQELKNHLSELLSAFEWSVQPGMHLEIGGRDNMKDRRIVRVQMTTTGRFVDVKTHSFEHNDRTFLRKGDSTLVVRSQLTSFWHRSPKHVWVQDRDELSFKVEPPEASVTVWIAHNAKPAARHFLRFPASNRGHWPLTFSQRQLSDTDDIVDRRLPGVYLYAQRAREQQNVEHVSAEITEALRALGYIQ